MFLLLSGVSSMIFYVILCTYTMDHDDSGKTFYHWFVIVHFIISFLIIKSIILFFLSLFFELVHLFPCIIKNTGIFSISWVQAFISDAARQPETPNTFQLAQNHKVPFALSV